MNYSSIICFCNLLSVYVALVYFKMFDLYIHFVWQFSKSLFYFTFFLAFLCILTSKDSNSWLILSILLMWSHLTFINLTMLFVLTLFFVVVLHDFTSWVDVQLEVKMGVQFWHYTNTRFFLWFFHFVQLS